MQRSFYGCEVVRHKLNNRQKCIFCVFRQFLSLYQTASRPYGWATSIPILSINSTHPRTNSWNFHKNILRTGNFEKLSYFELAILIFFASFPWKSVTNYVLEWMGLNFYYYDGLQPKISLGTIKEHKNLDNWVLWTFWEFICHFRAFYWLILDSILLSLVIIMMAYSQKLAWEW